MSPRKNNAQSAPVGSSHVRILEAAFALFRDKGIEATTTREIARAAQVNEVTIFRHFGSKASLIDAATRHCLSEATSRMTQGDPLHTPAPVAAVLRGLAQRVSQLSRDRSDILLMVLRNVHQYPQLIDIVNDERASLVQALREYMKQQMDAGNIRRMDPATAAALLFFPLTLVHALGEGTSRMTPPDLDVQDFERELTAMYLAYMLESP